jgi:ribokinase
MNQEYVFIAVAATVTDAFINIEQASVYKEHDQDGDGVIDEELCFLNGAKIPYESVTIIPAVGNSANAAVSAVRLGLHAAFVSDVGGDEHGREILATLTKQGVDTRFVNTHADMPSNYHYVLMHGAERTILIKHQKYPYKLPADMGNPKWLYFSSVGDDSLPYHEEIANYLAAHPNVKLAFQPGTFQIKLGKDALKDLYAHTEIFFCNVEEARIILGTSESEPAKLPKMMSSLGPKISVITDGPKGLYAYDSYSGKTYFMPPYPDPKPPVSRTGAGDACSSTITVALSLGKTLPEALQWGPINSMNVVQHVGAQTGLLPRADLEQLLASRPLDYVAKEVSLS